MNTVNLAQDSLPLPSSTPIYFSKFKVTHQVFHQTRHTFALVNIKPLLPGHVLICPLRPVARFSSLSPVETCDLFLVVQRVSRMLEKHYNATALNIVLQDGFDAGQSVPHVHVHIIPRTKGDMDDKGGVDAVYDLLEGEEGDLRNWDWEGERAGGVRVDDESLEARSEVEMAKEAEMYREEMDKMSETGSDARTEMPN